MLLFYLSVDFKERKRSLLDSVPQIQHFEDYVLYKIFSFRTALCNDLRNCVGRQGVTDLLNAITEVLTMAGILPNINCFECCNVGGGTSSSDMVCLGYILDDELQEVGDEEKTLEILKERMHGGNMFDDYTPETDVSIQYSGIYAGLRREKALRITIDIKHGSYYESNMPLLKVWMQGVNGLKHCDNAFSVMITPHKAKIFAKELHHEKRKLNTVTQRYSFHLPSECEPLVASFWEFVNALISILCSEVARCQSTWPGWCI